MEEKMTERRKLTLETMLLFAIKGVNNSIMEYEDEIYFWDSPLDKQVDSLYKWRDSLIEFYDSISDEKISDEFDFSGKLNGIIDDV